MIKKRRKVTPSVAVVGVGGAFVGAFAGAFLSGIVTGVLQWEGASVLPEALVTTAFWAGPLIIVVGVPAALGLELVMRDRPKMGLQLVVYGLTGVGLGLVYVAALGALMPDGTLRSLSLPIAMGALAALGGKVAAELYVRRGSDEGAVIGG